MSLNFERSANFEQKLTRYSKVSSREMWLKVRFGLLRVSPFSYPLTAVFGLWLDVLDEEK